MRPTRVELILTATFLALFLGPIFRPRATPPGQPEQGMVLARQLLADLLDRHDLKARGETFVYGHTPNEPAEYSYAVFSRDLKNGLYELDVQIRWKAIPDTKNSRGSRRMEVHLGQLVKGPI